MSSLCVFVSALLNLHELDDIGLSQGSVLLASLPWKCHLCLCVYVSALFNFHQVNDIGLFKSSVLLATLPWKCHLRLCVFPEVDILGLQLR